MDMNRKPKTNIYKEKNCNRLIYEQNIYKTKERKKENGIQYPTFEYTQAFIQNKPINILKKIYSTKQK